VLGLCFPDYGDPDIDGQDAAGRDAAGQDVDDVEQALYADWIIRGMERAARRHGYALVIAASLAGGPESLVAQMAGRVDGFAVLARTVATEDLELLSRRLPIVMVAGPREVDHLDHLEVANQAGERELTTHLIADHGLRRLAFVGGAAESPDANPRLLGYQEALRAADLPAPDEPDARGDLTQSGGRTATRRLLDLPLPQALVFANDQMAIGGLEILERRGVRVPEDVAVVGFDGIPLGRVVRPGLTTVTQPMRQLGETAVDLLVERLAEPTREPRSVMLPVTQTRRASCGCPPH
jgi:LacI family transcriptional regulator